MKLSELLNVLKKEEEIIGELASLSEKKTRVLVKSDLEGLRSIIEREHVLKTGLDALDERREGVLREIAGELKIEMPFGIDLIMEHAESPEKEELAALRERIKALLENLKKSNSMNTELIESHLAYINFVMSALTQKRAEATFYGQDGYRDESASPFFDNRA